MARPMKSPDLSPEYLAAGGASMTREQAVRHFKNREIALKAKIRSLPTPEKLRFAADGLEAERFPEGLALSVARLAVMEMEEADQKGRRT